jgi:hypothetical protein
MTSSAAVKALTVRSEREGGQSITIRSYSPLTEVSAVLSLVSLASTETSSTSAPARRAVEGSTSRLAMLLLMITSARGAFSIKIL